MLSAFKNFFVTLLIAAALFGVIAYFATQFVTATVSDIMGDENDALNDLLSQETETKEEATGTGETEHDPETVFPDDKVVAGESFSFVIVTSGYRPELFDDYLPTVEDLQAQVDSFKTASDSYGILSKNYREKTATGIVLVRVDKEREAVTYTYVTPETRVFSATGYHTLGEIYVYEGYETIGTYVTALTGIAVDFTFLLEGYNFDEFLAQFGTVWVNNPKNIYAEGMTHTTNAEYTVESTNEFGEKIVDHYSNSLVLNAGSLEFNEYSSFIMNTLKERSTSDIDAKGTYVVDLVKAYLTKIASLEEENFKDILIQAMDLPVEEETAPIPGEQEETVPDTETDIRIDPEPETGDETETGEEEPVVPREPEGPVILSDFQTDDIERIYELFHASTGFVTEVIPYPGTYVTASDLVEAYFDPDLEEAINRFLPYRFLPTANSTPQA